MTCLFPVRYSRLKKREHEESNVAKSTSTVWKNVRGNVCKVFRPSVPWHFFPLLSSTLTTHGEECMQHLHIQRMTFTQARVTPAEVPPLLSSSTLQDLSASVSMSVACIFCTQRGSWWGWSSKEEEPLLWYYLLDTTWGKQKGREGSLLRMRGGMICLCWVFMTP